MTRPHAVLAFAYGAGGYQGPLAAMDLLRPYLTSLLNFIGIVDVRTVAVEATTADSVTVDSAMQAALHDADALFTQSP